MTDINDLLNTEIEDPIKRDRWGRYLLPDPITGKEQPWTRATTLSGCLTDKSGLELWDQRNLVFGLGRRPDLFALAASVESTDDKYALSQIAKDAIEAAGGSEKSNLGTALHRFTERVDAGEHVEVPAQWKSDVEAYADTMATYGLAVVDGWIERQVVVPDLNTSGTLDRLIEHPTWKRPRIADVKTGKDVAGKMQEIAAQLAIYAHATHWWDIEAQAYHPMPEIDQETAVVMHIPVGSGTCELIEVDIASGWKAVQVAFELREWRKRKDLSWPMMRWDEKHAEPKPKAEKAPSPYPCEHCSNGYKSERGLKNHMESVHTPDELEAHQDEDQEASTPEPVVDNFDERFNWIKARVRNLVDKGHGDLLARIWNENSSNVPVFSKGGPTTHEQIDLLGGTCNLVEMSEGLEFFELDPALQTNTKHIKELIK